MLRPTGRSAGTGRNLGELLIKRGHAEDLEEARRYVERASAMAVEMKIPYPLSQWLAAQAPRSRLGATSPSPYLANIASTGSTVMSAALIPSGYAAITLSSLVTDSGFGVA